MMTPLSDLRARALQLARAGDPVALAAALRDAARASDLPALADLLRHALAVTPGQPSDAAAAASGWLLAWCPRQAPATLHALLAANAPALTMRAASPAASDASGAAAALALTLGAALGLCPPCVLLPSGRFFMGASPGDPFAQPFERPRHEVTLSRSMWVATTPVTQAQWLAVTAQNPMLNHNPSGFPGDDRRPIERVLWLEANHYCMHLGALLGFPPPPAPPALADDPDASSDSDVSPRQEVPWHARLHVPRPRDSAGPRLPTEAEWEYAARAGTDTPLYAGHLAAPSNRLDDALDAIAWYRENALGTTHPVGQKQPNAWGLYDMLGNVDEWCWDWEDEGPYIHTFLRKRVTDPTGPDEPPHRQSRRIRGASWYDIAQHCRVSYRRAYPPTSRNQSIGFRFVVTAPAADAQRGDYGSG